MKITLSIFISLFRREGHFIISSTGGFSLFAIYGVGKVTDIGNTILFDNFFFWK